MAASSKTSKGAASKQGRAGTTGSGQGNAKGTRSKQQTTKAAGSKQTAKSAGSTAKATRSSQAKTTKSKQQTAKATGSQRQTTKAASPKRQAAKTAGSRRQNANSKRQNANGAGSKQQTGIYVYGILPADVELTSEMPGVGDPPAQVRVIHSDGLAALVSEVDVAKPLGSPQDLAAHEQIVDATAGAVPVLPARFGAVLASEEEVAKELLAANHDEFDDSLRELEGRAQYVVKGRYVENAILTEVLSENRQAARLADKIRGADPDATREARIKLGEIINDAVTAKRHKDTRVLGDAMEGHCVASVVREPTHELDAVHVALLVDTDQESDLQQVIEDLARDWEERVELRLLGPMAAYDFVGTVLSEG